MGHDKGDNSTFFIWGSRQWLCGIPSKGFPIPNPIVGFRGHGRESRSNIRENNQPVRRNYLEINLEINMGESLEEKIDWLILESNHGRESRLVRRDSFGWDSGTESWVYGREGLEEEIEQSICYAVQPKFHGRTAWQLLIELCFLDFNGITG